MAACLTDSLHPATRYATEIVSGLRPSCKAEFAACQRHLNDLKRQGSTDFPYVFDETRAQRIYDWFQIQCRHVRGPFSGQPITLLPFQLFDLGVLFGWVHKDTGRRRFKKALNLRARGNVKSTEASGISLYGMCGDALYPPGKPEQRKFEDSPEVECAAVDKGQAKRVWGDALEMGKKSPSISKRLRIRRTYVEHISRGGWMRALSKDTKNKDSGAPCVVIVDEYHAHPTSEIHDVLYSGFGKRAQSLMYIISTAGKNAVNNPCKIEYDISKKILYGDIPGDDTFVMIRELDQGDNPHDKSLWVKANPVLQEDNEYSQVLREQIDSEYTAAYGSKDAAKIREFLTKRMDLWQADSEIKYLTTEQLEKWDSLAIDRSEFMRMVRGQECLAGYDLSKRTDLTADAHVFLLPDGRYAVTAHGYLPSEAVDRHERTDRVPYRTWADDGWVTVTEGPVVDFSSLESRMYDLEMEEHWVMKELEYDPAEATYYMSRQREKGYTCNEVRQGNMTLSEPTKRLREMILTGEIVHDGSPVLRWCLSNAVEVMNNGGLVRLTKKHKDDSQRIDLAAALINAMVRIEILENDLNEYVKKEGYSF